MFDMFDSFYRPRVKVENLKYILIKKFWSANGEELFLGEARNKDNSLQYAIFSCITKEVVMMNIF